MQTNQLFTCRALCKVPTRFVPEFNRRFGSGVASFSVDQPLDLFRAEMLFR
jgi:hypothetical protein